MDRQKCGKTFFQRTAESALDQKTRDDLRRINDALALALRYLRGSFTPAFGAKLFKVGDRLLEDMPQYRDRYVAAVVPLAKLAKFFRKLIRQFEPVRNRIGGKQAAIIGPDIEFFVALIHIAEQGLKVPPPWLRKEFISSAQGTLDEPVRQQTGALGERDEKNASRGFCASSIAADKVSLGPSEAPVKKLISRSRNPLYSA